MCRRCTSHLSLVKERDTTPAATPEQRTQKQKQTPQANATKKGARFVPLEGCVSQCKMVRRSETVNEFILRAQHLVRFAGFGISSEGAVRWEHLCIQERKVRTACEKVQKGTSRYSKISCGCSFADVLPRLRGGLLAQCTIWLTMDDNECTMQCKGQGSQRSNYLTAIKILRKAKEAKEREGVCVFVVFVFAHGRSFFSVVFL